MYSIRNVNGNERIPAITYKQLIVNVGQNAYKNKTKVQTQFFFLILVVVCFFLGTYLVKYENCPTKMWYYVALLEEHFKNIAAY